MSYIAAQIDREYRIKQYYQNKKEKENEKMDKTKCRRIYKES